MKLFFRLTKKQKEEKLEKEKKKEEEKKKLLIDWSEDENEEAEEFKKIQVKPPSPLDNFLNTPLFTLYSSLNSYLKFYLYLFARIQ